MEKWKAIKGYEGIYEVSNYGVVKSFHKNNNGVFISQHTEKCNHTNYKALTLSKDKVKTQFRVHRLVAEAFIDNPELKEQVNHKDCVKTNNKLSNLEWVTPIENILHAVENHRQRNQNGENNNMCKLTEVDVLFIRQLIDEGMTTYKIHKNYYPYLHQQTIYAIKQRRLWKQI